jgi:hypothetical protein
MAGELGARMRGTSSDVECGKIEQRLFVGGRTTEDKCYTEWLPFERQVWALYSRGMPLGIRADTIPQLRLSLRATKLSSLGPLSSHH